MIFKSREHAGFLLSEQLKSYRDEAPLVLALPGGGVPVARVIAEHLDADLDIILTEKVGAPLDPDYSIGSIGESGLLHLNESATYMEVPDRYLAEQIDRRVTALRELRACCSPYQAAIPFEGRTVILVEDGITTPDAMLGAVREVRGKISKRVIVAASVVASKAVRKLEAVADELVVLEAPNDLYAVSQFFDDFGEVTRNDVSRTLEAHLRKHEPGYAPTGLYRGDERLPPYDQQKIGGY